MSRPYQFGDKEDRVTSPLDRRAAAPYAQGQAPSFKTNVNRAKTKKWVEAKAPSYGGDDWDDYDEEDEYGVEAARDGPLPPLPGQNPGRSFTQPISPAVRGDRRNSFDTGDERRAFSSGFPQIPPGPQATSPAQGPLHVVTSINTGKSPATDSPSQYGSAAARVPSASSDLSSTNPEHRRDFSPSALPTPLRAAGSPAVTSPPGQFPPRQASSGVAQHASATEPPLPASPPASFIRPADIYKRHMEEEQRRSLESQRQSLDSDRSQEVTSPVQARVPLETVAERKSEYGLPGLPSVTAPATSGAGPRSSFAGLAMPTGLGGDTGFGDEFWSSTMGGSSGMTATAPASSLSPITEPHDPALQHQPSLGFTSLVHQAFDTTHGVSKQDSLRSQADATDSSVSRSNTTGTSDISPIMSRVPSSATAGAKLAERRQATPAIEEEAEGASRPTSQITEGSIPIGFTPGFRRDLNTPSPNNSPARSPAVESNNQLPMHGVTAEVGPNNPAAREADIVEAISSSPDKDVPFLASAETAAQGAFLESHKSDIPAASSKITRAESPSKGRVADLAGRFDDRPKARRGSVESWEADSVGSKRSRSTSPAKEEAPITLKPVAFERPQTERELSFRPKLPGGFESYASTRSTSPAKTTDTAPQLSTSSPDPPPKDDSGDLSDVDFTPTSGKHSVKGKDLTGSNAGPMAALAAAGAAMGEAFRKSLGSDEEPHDSSQPGDRLRGDVYSRPAPPDRLDTSASSLPPTPLPKDDDLPPTVPLKERSAISDLPEVVSPLPARLTFDSQPSMESGPGDFESDRLRREIVRSLSPEGDHRLGTLAEDSTPARADNRTSNAIPSEYDSYWAAGDDEKEAVASGSSSKDAPVPTSVYLPVSPPEHRAKSTSPNYLDKRFSWEKREEEEAAAATVAAAAVIGGGAAIAAHQASNSSHVVPQPAAISTSAEKDGARSATLQPEIDPLSLNPKLSGEGLHIVNAEPGELPTPVEAAPITPNRFSHMAPELYVPPERELGVHGGLSPIANEPPSPISPIPASPAGPRPPSGPRPKTGEEARPASFREILAIKSTPARIAKYEETRHQFANTNTGLGNWLTRTLEANPEHRDVAAAAHRPVMNPAGQPGPRHKTATSITRVFTAKGDNSPISSSYVDPGADYKSGPVSASASDQRASTGKSKDLGKDILKTAGVLGGKGMKEAKGLFSKGKSRFRGSGTDKDEEGFHSRPQTPSSMSISSQDSRPPSSKRSSRSFSPFHRFSRPTSVVAPDLPNHAEAIPEGSHSGDQRPTIVPPVQEQYWPEPVSVPTLSSNPTPESLLHRSLTPQASATRLGILPSPARSAFASDSPIHDLGALQKEHLLESVVRHSTPPFSPPVDTDRTPTQSYGFPPSDGTLLAPRAPNRINHHQRIVSLLQPEEIVPDDDKDDPVSPISPIEESIPEGFTRAVKPVGDPLSPTSPAISMDANSPVSLKQRNASLHLPSASMAISRDDSVKASAVRASMPQNGEARSIPKSRTSTDSWERESIADETTIAGAALAEPDESNSESDEPIKPKEPKGKEKVDDLAKLNLPATSLESAGHSRDTSVSSAIVEHAQAVQLKSQSDLEPTRHVALKPNDRLKDGADRLAAIAEAHRKMRAQFEEEDAARETPHDFLVMESAAKKFDDYAVSLHNERRVSGVQQSLQVPGQQWGAGRGNAGGRPRGSSITSTKTMPTAAAPSMIITEPMPDNSQRTKSLGATSGDNAVPPVPSSAALSLSAIPRSMPSVSSMGQEDRKSSADQSPVGPVSPVKTAFETREYHPPNPTRERPMSFVPLARDPSGLPVQELISTAKHPLDLDTQVATAEEHQRTPPSGGIRRMSRQFDNTQSTSPSGLRRMSRKFDEQGDTSPSGRRKSRHISLTLGGAQNVTPSTPEQPKDAQRAPSRQLSVTYSEGKSQSPPRPASPSLSMELEDPYRPVELYDRPASGASTNFPPPTNFQTMVNQKLRHGPPDVRHQGTGLQEPSVKPSPVDPIKKQGILQKLKIKVSTPSSAPQLSMQGPPPRIATPQEVMPPETQRLMSLQSRTSTMGSQDAPSKKDKKKRSSGFLGGLKRPVSADANSTLSGENSPVQTHQPAPVQPQFIQTLVPPSPQDSQQRPGSKSKKEKLPHRALTHTGQEVVGKKRFSGLGSLFGRSGTTGHAPNTGKKLSKEHPKGTIFHRVPENPATTAFEAQQRLQAEQWQNVTQRQGQHPPDLPLSPNQIGGIPPPVGGYYAPVNIPPPSGQNFGHASGVAGYDAIAAQQGRPPLAMNNATPVDTRAGSNASSNTRWLSFGRNSSTGSEALLSPQVSAGSPMEQYQRQNSGGSISPVSTRRDSSPGQVQGRPPKGFRMGSITETPGQHQERPWALNIPGAQEDEGDREIMRQEIFHAASQRWKRGPDGQMYVVPSDQPLQSPLGSPGYPGSPTPTSSSHPQLQAQPQPQVQGNPANPVFSYLPTQASQPAAHQIPIYQPTGSPPQGPPGNSLRMDVPGEYQRVGIPGEYQRVGYNPPAYLAPTTPDEPQIPPLPQAHLQLMQPQPKRLSYNGSPVASSAPMFEQATQDPRLDPSFRSRSNVSAVGTSTMSADPSPLKTFVAPSPPSRGVGSAPPPRGVPILGITTSMPMSVHQLPRSHSYAQPPSQHVLYQHQQQQASQSAHPTSADDLYADPSRRFPTREATSAQLPEDLYGYQHDPPKTAALHGGDEEERPPPPLPKDTPPTSSAGHVPLSKQTAEPVPQIVQAVSGQGLGGNGLAAQLAQAGISSETGRGHERNMSEESDEAPVMKASGYPGDEWIPSWDGLD